ncbi:bifunctional riboflavin kinase/FAD synthetase [bacterium]|jgi:riboflavin kinase / FMN adenylyltransferase|nr:bifunctional riboflavin kinase/FAD synthetase [bacterium]MBT3795043.1 bifunctional riboflavin kinase/FAD synthetase [bacterium]MBT4634899.1 bifunctional riboflavin kinase/FAD synthetase [bacterium]
MLKLKPRTLLIGNFDGVHLGHQSLIEFAKKIARESDTELSILTFKPHPREVILNKKVDLILPYFEKIKMLKSFSVNSIDEIGFNKEISKMSPNDFISKFLEASGAVNIIVGKDFKFGIHASGNVDTLVSYKKSLFKVHAIEIEHIVDKRISSSLIKEFLSQGCICEVNRFLGRNYYIKGEVVEGEKRGRQIGFPTTNLKTEWNLLPKEGVYVTYIFVNGKRYDGITNIGYRPTFGKKDLLIESHLFDFNEFIYGLEIKIEFLKRIRSEKKFDSVEELIENIKKDVLFAKKRFSEESNL